MESDSNKWFRDKWNNFEKSKYIEDNWFRVFKDNMEDIILDKHLKIDKKLRNQKMSYGWKLYQAEEKTQKDNIIKEFIYRLFRRKM